MNTEFKGTKGLLEKKYVSGICIGIGTIGNYSQITSNSILPETDKEYDKEKVEIESNMQLYATAPELLEALQNVLIVLKDNGLDKVYSQYAKAEKTIQKALNP